MYENRERAAEFGGAETRKERLDGQTQDYQRTSKELRIDQHTASVNEAAQKQ